MRPGNSTWGKKALLRLTTSMALGALLTIATVSAASDPAAAANANSLAAPQAQTTVAHANGIEAMSHSDLAKAERPAPTATAADPLAAIVPVAAAEEGDLRARIISLMPLTDAPEVEGADTAEAGASAGDYLRFEEMRVPRWIVDAVLRASEVTGVDPVYMMALADKESSFIPDNKASSSSAQGLYQFISSTWIEVIRSFGAQHGLTAEAEAVKVVNGQLTVPDEAMREHILGLRRNPYISALMAAEMKKRDRAKIEQKIGREINRSEFYLSHFFGVDGAGKFISMVDEKPKQSAPRLFPAAAKANKALFFAKAGRKTRQLTVAEVYDKIDEMIDSRLNRYEGVSAVAVAGVAL
ncbi:transglycosylase SLT domain-containing protein [Microvirga sp. GCM10011540]|uniref:transglycosylase SLT domain-containing protein n=1 Tax=Microvirga sp. GCM10011540 TaxID=3317338 RepID=UPI0036113494